jgi:hypothetical protein
MLFAKYLAKVDDLPIYALYQWPVLRPPLRDLLIHSSLKWRVPHDDTSLRINVLIQKLRNSARRIAEFLLQKLEMLQWLSRCRQYVQRKLKLNALIGRKSIEGRDCRTVGFVIKKIQRADMAKIEQMEVLGLGVGGRGQPQLCPAADRSLTATVCSSIGFAGLHFRSYVCVYP